MKATLTRLSLLMCLCLFCPRAYAQWQLDGAPIVTAYDFQVLPVIVSDGAGGAIIAWHDARNSGTYDIYVQRVNAAGVSLWATGGVALCAAANSQYALSIVADGAGGAIVAWQDYRTANQWDIYAQRVSASGVPLWLVDGVPLCAAPFNQNYPTIASDGASGAIVAWEDTRTLTLGTEIYAQRVNASGVPQWTADGVAVCTATNSQFYAQVVADGAGGAIVSWNDYRNGAADIYAQRVNVSGIPQWAVDGAAICIAANDQAYPAMITDGAGGAILTWEDQRYGVLTRDIFAQRVNASGAAQWIANGVVICDESGIQFSPTVTSDGAGGAIIAWSDYRSASNSDIYSQRVSAAGSRQWTHQGVAICTVQFDQSAPAIVSDGASGAIITWHDVRNATDTDIYAQRVNWLGALQWTPDGVDLCTTPWGQNVPRLVSDGVGGAIATWEDNRGGVSDVYAQHVEADYGTWGMPQPIVTSVSDVPDDQGGKVAVNWTRSDHDVLPLHEISHYSVWRAVDPVAVPSATAGDFDGWTDPSSIGPDFRGPALAHERVGATDYYWEWVSNQNSTHDAGYSMAASTREDSVSGNAATHHFRVLAHTGDPYVLYKSNVASGHSVDNLAPLAPFLLAAQRVGGDVHLKWDRAIAPDLRDYSVYRATSTGVTPVPINFLESAEDTLAVDANAPSSALYYIVTAFDVHANQSDPSNEASVGALTGVGDTPALSAFTVLDNMPNPFTSSTTLRVGLPKASDVEIEVFDVAGRRVRNERTTVLASGWREISFDARDSAGKTLPSGVYFYRVSASGATVTKKMVIAR